MMTNLDPGQLEGLVSGGMEGGGRRRGCSDLFLSSHPPTPHCISFLCNQTPDLPFRVRGINRERVVTLCFCSKHLKASKGARKY